MESGYTMVVNLIVGGIVKGLIMLGETRLPNIPNYFCVSVALAAGVTLGWLTAQLFDPSMTLDQIATSVLAGLGGASALNSASNRKGEELLRQLSA